MFIIQVGNDSFEWQNDFSDDFIRFLPKHFKCGIGDLKVYWKQGEEVKECISWPYDADMKFLGNSFK